MHLLQVSDFPKDRSKGAAGALVDIEEGLRARGVCTESLWKSPRRKNLLGADVAKLTEIPFLQYRQVSAYLAHNPVDVVIISQPHAWRIYRDLKRKHPGVLFLNFTHGWEARVFSREQEWRETIHGPRGLARKWMQNAVTRQCALTARHADGLITSCELDRRFIAEFHGIPPSKITVIPQGLSPEFRGKLPPAPRPIPPKPAILFVGQYQRRKGIHILREILSNLHASRAFTLTVVTDPGHHAEARDDFSGLGEDFILRPWVNRSELAELYLQHHFFVLPSLFEGFGRVYLEAMAFGLCLVGFAEGALPDLAEHGKEALYTLPGDSEGLTELLRFALATPKEMEHLRANAMAKALTFTPDHAMARLLDFIDGLGKGGRTP